MGGQSSGANSENEAVGMFGVCGEPAMLGLVLGRKIKTGVAAVKLLPSWPGYLIPTAAPSCS